MNTKRLSPYEVAVSTAESFSQWAMRVQERASIHGDWHGDCQKPTPELLPERNRTRSWTRSWLWEDGSIGLSRQREMKLLQQRSKSNRGKESGTDLGLLDPKGWGGRWKCVIYLEHKMHIEEELNPCQKNRLSADFRGPKMPWGTMKLSPYNKQWDETEAQILTVNYMIKAMF